MRRDHRRRLSRTGSCAQATGRAAVPDRGRGTSGSSGSGSSSRSTCRGPSSSWPRSTGTSSSPSRSPQPRRLPAASSRRGRGIGAWRRRAARRCGSAVEDVRAELRDRGDGPRTCRSAPSGGTARRGGRRHRVRPRRRRRGPGPASGAVAGAARRRRPGPGRPVRHRRPAPADLRLPGVARLPRASPSTGRSSRLRINYRSTEEILAWSTGVLDGSPSRSSGGEGTDTLAGLPLPAARDAAATPRGTRPSRRRSTALVDRVQGWIAQGIRPQRDRRVRPLQHPARQGARQAGGRRHPGGTGRRTARGPDVDGVRLATMHAHEGAGVPRVSPSSASPTAPCRSPGDHARARSDRAAARRRPAPGALPALRRLHPRSRSPAV